MGLLDNTISDTIILNLVPGTRSPRLHCSKYDVGRMVNIELYNMDDPYTIDSYWCTIEGGKPDGTAFAYSITGDLSGTITGNAIKFKLLNQMTNVAGDVPCELVLYNAASHTRIASLNFILDVEKGPVNDRATDSSTDFGAMMNLYADGLSQVQAAVSNAEAAAARAEAAANKVLSYELIGTTLKIKAVTS